MAEPGFNAKVEQVRLAAARELPPSCLEDFQRLSRSLVYGPTFQWLLVNAPDEALRHQVMRALDEVLRAAGMRSNRLPLSARIADVAMLETRLLKNAGQAEVVHVLGRPGWFNEARWDAFNVRRERLAAESRARLVFWLDADAIALASRGAPDLWAWRGGVYSFVPSGASLQAPMAKLDASGTERRLAPFAPPPTGADNRSHEERVQRVAEIRSWLATSPTPPDELLAAPIDELGRLLFSLGDYDAALAHWRDVEVPLHERLGDVRAKAVAMGQIADILYIRGQLDEALRIRQEEQLPVYERLGDVRSKAVTMGKIADILHARGQLDEALHIRQEEELPVYERLDDVREKAVTMGKIADILHAHGQFDEALRIHSEEVRPAFERLGDMHAKAVTMGKIADILHARGQLDEALRIRQEEELPVYERLGDVHSKAVTMGKIADIVQDRGQFDEALRIRQEEQLPIFERLGDARSKAVTMGKIADIVQDRGQFDEALRIRQEEELPVYEHLDDVRSLLVCRTNLAQIFAERGHEIDRPKIDSLLRDAHAAAQDIRLPEAEQIAGIYLRIFGHGLVAK